MHNEFTAGWQQCLRYRGSSGIASATADLLASPSGTKIGNDRHRDRRHERVEQLGRGAAAIVEEYKGRRLQRGLAGDHRHGGRGRLSAKTAAPEPKWWGWVREPARLVGNLGCRSGGGVLPEVLVIVCVRI